MPSLFSTRLMSLFVVLIGLQAVSPILVDVTSVALLAASFWSPKQAFRALSLAAVVRFLNPAFVTLGQISVVIFLAMPLLVTCRYVWHLRRSDWIYVAPVCLFAFVAAICSLVSSPTKVISLLKAFNFGWVVVGIYIVILRASVEDRAEQRQWIYSLAGAVAFVSLATLVSPSRAFHPDTTLLRGALLHPQALGTYLAPFLASLAVGWSAGFPRSRKRLWLGTSLLFVVILLTRSRTAMIAVALAFGVCLLWSGGRRERGADGGRDRLLRMVGIAFVLSVFALASQLSSNAASSYVGSLIFKRGGSELGEALEVSRGAGAEEAWRRFLESPVFGNGFGVLPEGSTGVGVTRILGVPVSAPTEKGFLPAAVLDETGMLGGAAFLYLIFNLVWQVRRTVPQIDQAMVHACLLVNLGEAVLFSPGGLGLHIWLLIAFAGTGGRYSADALSPFSGSARRAKNRSRFDNLMARLAPLRRLSAVPFHSPAP